MNRKKVAAILGIVSAVIFCGGVLLSVFFVSIFSGGATSSQPIMMDGSDLSPLVRLSSLVGSVVIPVFIMSRALLYIGIIWAIYGIICLILYLVNKNRSKKRRRN